MNWPSSLKSLSCDADHSARNFRNRWDRAFGPKEPAGGIVPQQGPFADDAQPDWLGPQWRFLQSFMGGETMQPTREQLEVDYAVLAERERCAGVARNAIREADGMLGGADVEWFRSSLKLVLDGMDPTEGKYSLSREQEQKDAIAEAVDKERERCAKIADTWDKWSGRTGYDAEEYACQDIAARIRSSE